MEYCRVLEQRLISYFTVRLWCQGRQAPGRALVTLILKPAANDHRLRGKITVGAVGTVGR